MIWLHVGKDLLQVWLGHNSGSKLFDERKCQDDLFGMCFDAVFLSIFFFKFHYVSSFKKI
jgi:hypothetical protein